MQTQINFRIDKKLKKEAESILATWGLTSAQALRIFFHKIIREGGLPFALKPENHYDFCPFPSHEPNDETIAALEDNDPANYSPVRTDTFENFLEDLGCN